MPALPLSVEKRHDASMAETTRDSLRVLLFATSAATRAVGDALDEQPGVSLVSAETATEPADTLADTAADCVVCDHDPPAVDVTAVAAAATDCGLPTLLVSGRPYDDLDGDPLAAGPVGFHRVLDGDPQPRLALRRVERAVADHEQRQALDRTEAQLDALFHNPDKAIGILDTDGTLTAVNEAALAFAGIFGDGADIVGRPFWETPWVTRASMTKGDVLDGIERAEAGDSKQFVITARDTNHNLIEVETTFRPIEGEVGIEGILVTGLDITTLRSQERRLRVLTRILRHNVRNDLEAITGHTDFIQEQGSGEIAEHATAVQRVADDLVDKSELARRVEQALSVDRRPVPTVDVAAVLRSELDRIERDYDAVEIDRTIPETQRARAEDGIDIAVRSLLENAVEHSDRDQPQLTVMVETVAAIDGGSGPAHPEQAIEIRIADNGPGIPDHEIAVIDEGVETALDHSSGLGLWAANWIVEDSGGSLSFELNEPHGTVAVITLALDSEV
jgi:PAS domain S-box-containing protein